MPARMRGSLPVSCVFADAGDGGQIAELARRGATKPRASFRRAVTRLRAGSKKPRRECDRGFCVCAARGDTCSGCFKGSGLYHCTQIVYLVWLDAAFRLRERERE